MFAFYVGTAADRRQQAAAAVIAAFLLALLAISFPLANAPLPVVPAFLALATGVASMAELLTAVILLVKFTLSRRPSLALLGCTYLFSSIMIIGFLAYFPGMMPISPTLHRVAPWLYWFWHAGTAVLVFAYTLVRRRERGPVLRVLPASILRWLVPAVVGGSIALIATLGSFAPHLPTLVVGSDISRFTSSGAGPVALLLLLLALWVVARERPLRTVDLWVAVALFALLVDLVLLTRTADRFSFSWYAARVAQLTSSFAVLSFLIYDIFGAYRKLVQESDALAVRAKAEELRFEQTVNYAGIGIAHVDRAGNFLLVNEKVCAICGFARDELLTMRLSDLFESGEGQAIAADGAATERRIRRKDGSEVWAEIVTSYPIDVGETSDYLIVLLSDIGLRKEAEAEALRVSRMRLGFIATVSHEIRTPLNGIVGMSELLRRADLPGREAAYAGTIGDSAESLLFLVNNLLDFSRLESGKLDLERRPLDVRELVESVVAPLAVQARQKRVEVSTFVDESVPSAILGDALRLQQILSNLLGNAVKFTDRGTVGVKVSRARNLLVFSVTDTGVGIARESLGRIFESFTQADSSTTRRFGGTGLGLAIVRDLVGMMGGHVTVESELGRGSTFTVTIECEPAEDEHVAPPLAAHGTAGVSEHRAGRILIAEDNEVNRRVTLAQLQSLGYRADVVRDGRSAVSAAQEGTYDLLFMDCQMPDLDGMSAARAIRAARTDGRPRIVALTANALATSRDACFEAGMDDYLAKPLRLDALSAVLERWLPVVPAAQDGFDMDRLMRIFHGDVAAIDDLIVTALDSVTGAMVALESAVAMRRACGVSDEAHKIAGIAADVGNPSLARFARGIEQAARADNWDEILLLRIELGKVIERAMSHRAYHGTASSAG